MVLSRFGLAGTLAGAALAPVILTLVKELGRRPAEVIIARAPVPRRDGASRRPPAPRLRTVGRLARVRWGVVAATSLIALLVSVAVFTVPELIAGRSVVADRPSTFFSAGSSDGTAAGEAPGGADDSPADGDLVRTDTDETETAAPEDAPPAPTETVTAPAPTETVTVPAHAEEPEPPAAATDPATPPPAPAPETPPALP